MAMMINAALLVSGGAVSWLTIRNDVLRTDSGVPLDGDRTSG
jgi:hypothetical protein